MRRAWPTKLTQRQAWHVLAMVFGFRAGLCFSVDQLVERKLITIGTADRMYRRISGYMRDTNCQGMYAWPMPDATLRSGDSPRWEFAQTAADTR